MIVTIVREKSNETCTIGKLYIDGKFFCYTLEDAYHPEKIKHKTRIPSGSYKLELRYSPKFSPSYNHDMIWVKDVPGFEFILIHKGNDADDTSGCILVGIAASGNIITGSKVAYDKLYPIIFGNIKAGATTILTVVDADRSKNGN